MAMNRTQKLKQMEAITANRTLQNLRQIQNSVYRIGTNKTQEYLIRMQMD